MAGTLHIDEIDSTAQIRGIIRKNVKIHKEYDGENHNIAMVFLAGSPLNFTDYVQPIQMPRGSVVNVNLVGETGVVSGWGGTDNPNSQSTNDLQYVRMTVKNDLNCGLQRICTDTDCGTKCTRNGDVGSPFVINNRLVGVASTPTKLCNKNVFTAVAGYLSWVSRNTGLSF